MSVAAQSQSHKIPPTKCLKIIEQKHPFPSLHVKDDRTEKRAK